jgi:L-rhamnose mutarotase
MQVKWNTSISTKQKVKHSNSLNSKPNNKTERFNQRDHDQILKTMNRTHCSRCDSSHTIHNYSFFMGQSDKFFFRDWHRQTNKAALKLKTFLSIECPNHFIAVLQESLSRTFDIKTEYPGKIIIV